MLPFSKELYFHREHTWVKREHRELGDLFRIGLDEIFFKDFESIEQLDLPTEGDEISQDEVCGVIRSKESRKHLYAPLSGEIVEVNYELHEDPDIIREDPYGIGWIILLDPMDVEEEIENLLHGKEAEKWWKKEIELRGSKPS